MQHAYLADQRLRTIFSLLTGAVGLLAFSPYDIWPAALLALASLLLVINNRTSRQAAWLGFSWGVGLFGCGIQWVSVSIEQFGGLPFAITVLLVALLTAYLALYPALFCLLLIKLFPNNHWTRLLFAAPALWQITEALRTTLFSGFSWLQFGYSQIDGPLSGLAPIAGIESLTFMLVFLSSLTTLIIMTRRITLVLALFLLLTTPSGLQKLHWTTVQPERTMTVALVQGNIQQAIKWQPEQLKAILDTYLTLSEPLLGQAELIIWPENAIPTTITQAYPKLSQINARWGSANSQLITGIVDQQPDGRYFNSIIVLGNSPLQHTLIPQRYRKHHLVPFGEVVPFATLLRPLAPLFNLPLSSFSCGARRQAALVAGHYRFASAICYEITLGNQLRDNFDPQIDFLLTLSNDSWFNDTNGPWQHFQMARMRALELGRPLLRATNNGITAVIDAQGKVIAQLPQFQAEVLQVHIAPTRGMTPYAQWGNTPLWLLTGLSLVAAGWLHYRSQRNKS